MNPLRSWHRLDGSVKLAVYTRLSIEFIIVSFGLYLVILGGVMLHRAGHVVWQVVAGIAVAMLFTVVGVLITELRPEFNIGQRRSLPRLLPFAAVVTALTWVVALVAYHSDHDATADAGLYLLLIVLTLPPVGVLPWLPWRWTIGVVAAGVTTWVAFPDLGWIPAFVALFLLITTVLSAWTVGVARQLNRARLTESALQVSEERLRFAQELHDTLGQRLAAISVKAELARAFVARGDARSDAELADLQALVRTSVNEMHEVVDGYRSVELSSEIDNARVLLESSGVRFDLDGDAASVKGSTRELAAWLVREATTNILRHSDATWVRISVESGRVTVTNDGASRAIGRMSGLAGIQHRAHPAGARVTAVREGSLFTVTLKGGVR